MDMSKLFQVCQRRSLSSAGSGKSMDRFRSPAAPGWASKERPRNRQRPCIVRANISGQLPAARVDHGGNIVDERARRSVWGRGVRHGGGVGVDAASQHAERLPPPPPPMRELLQRQSRRPAELRAAPAWSKAPWTASCARSSGGRSLVVKRAAELRASLGSCARGNFFSRCRAWLTSPLHPPPLPIAHTRRRNSPTGPSDSRSRTSRLFRGAATASPSPPPLARFTGRDLAARLSCLGAHRASLPARLHPQLHLAVDSAAPAPAPTLPPPLAIKGSHPVSPDPSTRAL